MIVTVKVKMNGLGDRLRELRVRQGIKQEDLAQIMGCSGSYISKIEREADSGGISYDSLLEILSALEVSPVLIQEIRERFEKELTELIFSCPPPVPRENLLIDGQSPES
jgi:transcriptional regulator with XRE-family HTH domain